MAHGDYERLTSEAIEKVCVRLRAGQAAKPTDRELGLRTGTALAYLLRRGGIRPSRVYGHQGDCAWPSGRR